MNFFGMIIKKRINVIGKSVEDELRFYLSIVLVV